MKPFSTTSLIPIPHLATICIIIFTAPSSPALSGLDSMVRQALADHPLVVEAKAEAEQARYRYQERYGFFDPAIYLAAGASDQLRTVPGLGNLGSMSSEAFEIQASLQVPVRPGFYFNIGIAERHFHNSVNSGQNNQSLFGIGLRIPLLQDRGFKTWDLERLQYLAEWDQALNNYLATRQRLRHELEQNIINLSESIMLNEIARGATARLESLLEETETLARHQEIAEYQIFAARMEVDLSRIHELSTEQTVQIWLIRLAELLGGRQLERPSLDRDQWLTQAAQLAIPQWDPDNPPFRSRGDYLNLLHQRVQAEIARQAEAEKTRGDLSLRAAATIQESDESLPLSSLGAADSSRLGGHLMVVYERPLGFHAERERMKWHERNIARMEASLQALELTLTRDTKASATRFQYALERFDRSQRAVDLSHRSLESENERFRLGEARSRDVLNAQTDVTNAERQQVTTAADLQRARSDYNFATGYWQQPEKPPLE